MNRSKKIQKYLDKQMTEKESAEFEIELRNNPELYEEMLLHKEVDASIKDLIGESMFLKNLELAHQSYMKNAKENKSSKIPIINISRKQFPKLVAAAAILILLSVGAFYMFAPNPNTADKLYLSYYSPYEVAGTNRSGNEGEVSLQVKAMQKFEQKEYQNAIKLFDQMNTNGSTNISSNFYKGIAYLELNKPNDAIKSLEIVIKNETNELTADAEWYLGLAYLKANDIANAKKQFAKVSEKYSFYKKKADEILLKIQE